MDLFQKHHDGEGHVSEDVGILLHLEDENALQCQLGQIFRDDADGSAVFGATKDDMKTLTNKSGTVSLSEEAKKHGGRLDMKQMMRLAGHDV